MIKMKVNSEPAVQMKIPSVRDQMSNPGESWLIGGPLQVIYLKFINFQNHVNIKNNFQNKDFSSNLIEEVLTKTFRGYIYSFKKDGVETLTTYQKATNVEGFLPILSSSIPSKA